MLNKIIEILLSLVLLIPVFWRLHRYRFHSTKQTLLYLVFGVYLSAVYLFVGMPTVQFLRFDVSLTLIPFLPMAADFRNTLLNILLFVPLGILLPFLWSEYRTAKAAVTFGFGMSLAIELLQILTYRATDINDLIANTLGTAVGYGIFRMASHWGPARAETAGKKGDLIIILVSVFLVMFFLQPWLAAAYYAFS